MSILDLLYSKITSHPHKVVPATLKEWCPKWCPVYFELRCVFCQIVA